MNQLRIAFALLLVFTLLALLAAVGSGAYAWRERAKVEDLSLRLSASRELRRKQTLQVMQRREQAAEILDFLRAWQPYLEGDRRERDPATSMRASLEVLAQRRLGLVTDQITTPEPRKAGFGGHRFSVQPVSVRASGENLSLLLAWIGESEALYPLARVDRCELAGAPSGNLSLQVSFSQPVTRQDSLLMEHPK